MKRFKTVDDYMAAAEQWQDELKQLRKILQSTPLTEEVKWGAPCYTFNNKMVVGLGSFKSYVGLWFFQGALLADRDGVLMNAQDGKTKAMRQWRFATKKEIKPAKIKAYVKEAIGLVEAGKEIKADRDKPVIVPPELKQALAADKTAGAAFRQLGKGKQREYTEYISSAKREETKTKRLEKILPLIAAGQGLHDKYR